MLRRLTCFLLLAGIACAAPPASVRMGRAELEDRIRAVWTAQMISVLLGWQFEHKPAAAAWVDHYTLPVNGVPIDDDWYYEMAALKGFEKYGIGMTVAQLGKEWVAHNAGTWGSSEQARLNLLKGIEPPATGHPRYNRLWFTMGNQCRGDLWGLLAPGLPNVAARMSREYGHINSYAEGTDGGILLSGMISIAMFEKDMRSVVLKARAILDPSAPHRKILDSIIDMQRHGKTQRQISDALEDYWHIEYPATNNAVLNFGHAATGLWFGEGDFRKTLNIVYQAGDFSDADCNGALAGAVCAAMHGSKGLPRNLVEPLGDRIRGDSMGHLKFPAVDETITNLARRTMAIAEKMLAANGAKLEDGTWVIPQTPVKALPVERFTLPELTKYWNPEWTLERAGFGAPGGGVRGIRGGTFVDGDVLATYPRDEVRGTLLRRTLKLGAAPKLTMQVAADAGRAWQLTVYVNNDRLLSRTIEGGKDPRTEPDKRPLSVPQLEYVRATEVRQWQPVSVDLKKYAGQEAQIRLFQTVLVQDRVPGNAYWKEVRVQ